MKLAKFTPAPPTWADYFTTNRAALEEELQHLIAELTRRLAEALDEGDLDEAREMWDDGVLASQIERVLRDGR